MGTWRRVWIADFYDIESLREKLGSKHGIDVDDFIAQTKVKKNLLGGEEYSEVHGLRTVIEVKLNNGKTVRAYLDLSDEYFDIWSIRTGRYLD